MKIAYEYNPLAAATAVVAALLALPVQAASCKLSIEEPEGTADLNDSATRYVEDNIETYEQIVGKNLKNIKGVRVSRYALTDADYEVPTPIWILLDSDACYNCTEDMEQECFVKLTKGVSSTAESSFSQWQENTTSVTFTASAEFEGTGLSETFEESVTNGVETSSGTSSTETQTMTRSASYTLPPSSGAVSTLWLGGYEHDEVEVQGRFQIPDDATVEICSKRKDNDPHVRSYTYQELASQGLVINDGMPPYGEVGSVAVHFTAEGITSGDQVMSARIITTDLDEGDVKNACASVSFQTASSGSEAATETGNTATVVELSDEEASALVERYGIQP